MKSVRSQLHPIFGDGWEATRSIYTTRRSRVTDLVHSRVETDVLRVIDSSDSSAKDFIKFDFINPSLLVGIPISLKSHEQKGEFPK